MRRGLSGAFERALLRANLTSSSGSGKKRSSAAFLVSESLDVCARRTTKARPTDVSGEHSGKASGQGDQWLEARHEPVRREEGPHPGGRKHDAPRPLSSAALKCDGPSNQTAEL